MLQGRQDQVLSQSRSGESLHAPNEVQAQDDDFELDITETYPLGSPEETIDLTVLDTAEDYWYALRWAYFHSCIPTSEVALSNNADVDHQFTAQADYIDWLSYTRVNGYAAVHPKTPRRRMFKAAGPLLAALYDQVLSPNDHDFIDRVLLRMANVNLEDHFRIFGRRNLCKFSTT
ncbi:hypothetical protein LY76DRAFT_610032 [Colletotrichum caudatum]|nr:hypothetical protein LY76DRAFT_610032 [Colletotrichum caudatum]